MNHSHDWRFARKHWTFDQAGEPEYMIVKYRCECGGECSQRKPLYGCLSFDCDAESGEAEHE